MSALVAFFVGLICGVFLTIFFFGVCDTEECPAVEEEPKAEASPAAVDSASPVYVSAYTGSISKPILRPIRSWAGYQRDLENKVRKMTPVEYERLKRKAGLYAGDA